MSSSKASHDDPRDSSLEQKITFPKTWSREYNDALTSSAMFLSGLILMTRNRFLAWPALMLGITGVINQRPLRTKEGGTGPWSTILLTVVALIASYLPYIVLPASPSPK